MNRFKVVSFRNFITILNVIESDKSFFRLTASNFSNHKIRFSSVVPYNKRKSPLEKDENLDLSSYGAALLPTYNLAAYANKSKLLQEFIKLGVNLHKFENDPQTAKFILQLDYEKNVKDYLLFLHDNGVSADKLGNFITKNPFIFHQTMNNLNVRINYLKSKKFSQEMISIIITNHPLWLNQSVTEVDKVLGYLQQAFKLKGDEIRQLITKVPSLISVKKKKFMLNTYILKEEMGLDNYATKKLILNVPSLLKADEYKLCSTFEYITKQMKIPVDLVLKQPHVLLCRKFILMERHKFLQALGRAQYNPLLPGYISLINFVTLNDDEFCEKIARVSPSTFNEFLKTL